MAVLRFPPPAAEAYEATTTKTLWTWPGSSRRIASGCTPWTSGSFFFIGPARTDNSGRQAASHPRYLDDLECPYVVLARGRGEEIDKEDEHDDDAVARESRPLHPPDSFLRLCDKDDALSLGSDRSLARSLFPPTSSSILHILCPSKWRSESCTDRTLLLNAISGPTLDGDLA
jgi:hypothetical protein